MSPAAIRRARPRRATNSAHPTPSALLFTQSATVRGATAVTDTDIDRQIPCIRLRDDDYCGGAGNGRTEAQDRAHPCRVVDALRREMRAHLPYPHLASPLARGQTCHPSSRCPFAGTLDVQEASVRDACEWPTHEWIRSGATRSVMSLVPTTPCGPTRRTWTDGNLRPADRYRETNGPRVASCGSGRRAPRRRPGTFRAPSTAAWPVERPRLQSAEMDSPLPDLFVYGRPGCHLCDDSRALVTAILDERRGAGLATRRSSSATSPPIPNGSAHSSRRSRCSSSAAAASSSH